MTIIALLPAHNEEENILLAIAALRRQTTPPDRIVVVADNCTDGTVALAHQQRGVEVFRTIANSHKKAGALNQALDRYLPPLSDDDSVLVQDADSFLDPDFLQVAQSYIAKGKGAVGGTFRGREGGGVVGWFQRNEYARYERDVRRLHGRKQPLVLTGTATLFRVETFRAVFDRNGYYYDVEVLTEDNRLTFDLIDMGIPFVTPPECTLTTEVMETWRSLAQQRLRWKRGALENLKQYGFKPRWTWPYWGRQAVSMLGCLAMISYLISLVIASFTGFHFRPMWLLLSTVFMLERTITVRSRGRLAQVLASTLIVEMPYDLFVQGVHLRAVWQSIRNRERRW